MSLVSLYIQKQWRNRMKICKYCNLNKRDRTNTLDNKLSMEMIRVFTDILENSEPLPHDFAKILHDNMWELLVRT